MHFAGDVVASATVLVGLVFVELGVREGDSIAALLVAALIVAAATRLIAENANVLMDRTPEEAREAAERAIADLGAEIELSRLRLRESAGRYFADVVVAVPPGQAVVEGHQAADLVEAAVERVLPGSDVVVHVEPRSRDLSLRDRVLAIALEEPLVLEAHDIMIFQRPGAVSVALHLKFPADLDLGSAAQIAARVERAISHKLDVAAVQTHLEPLEQTLRARASDPRADAEAEAEIQRLVTERTGSPPSKSTSSESTPAAPATSTSTSPATGGGEGQTQLSLGTNPEGQLKFDKTTLGAKAGKVSIAYTNGSPIEHNLTIESSAGATVGATETFTGGSKTLTVTLKAGTYKFYCSVPGHRQAGMEGTLTVK